MQLMLFNLFSPALKLNTGLAILSPGAFEVHSDGIDVDNELFHYPIKKAYTPYNIHTYKTEEVVNQRNIKVKNMTLDEIGNDSNLLIVFYVQIMPDDFVMQFHRF
ncbi:putative T3SS effector-like protein [Escherichia coli]|nr:putative T3SS effector-like protein [Escherichia coli]